MRSKFVYSPPSRPEPMPVALTLPIPRKIPTRTASRITLKITDMMLAIVQKAGRSCSLFKRRPVFGPDEDAVEVFIEEPAGGKFRIGDFLVSATSSFFGG